MTVRKRKKKNKLRGQRTHGKGNTKNNRGKGSRGGKGKAGSHKHNYTKYYATFGKTNVLKSRKKEKAINLELIEEKKDKWIKKGLLTKKSDFIIIDGRKIDYQKILGKGNISFKVLIKNMKVSENARKKIEEKKGVIEERKNKKQDVEIK